MDRTVDLKREPALVEQYVSLRNSYPELLLTSPVTVPETLQWLTSDQIEVLGLAEGKSLLGAAVLYLSRGNEIAFFVKEPGKGVGTRLLAVIEDAARRKGLARVWAWVLKRNVAAQRSFEKAGFARVAETARDCAGRPETGIEYEKLLSGKGAA